MAKCKIIYEDDDDDNALEVGGGGNNFANNAVIKKSRREKPTEQIRNVRHILANVLAANWPGCRNLNEFKPNAQLNPQNWILQHKAKCLVKPPSNSVPWSLVDETLDNTDLNTSQPTRMARTALFYYLPLNMDKDGHSLSAAPRAELDNGASGLQARLVLHMAQIDEASPSEDESFTEHILHENGNDVNEYEADLNDVSMMAWQNPQATGSGQYTRPSMGRLAANSLFREHEANASTNNSPDVQPTGSRRYMQPSLDNDNQTEDVIASHFCSSKAQRTYSQVVQQQSLLHQSTQLFVPHQCLVKPPSNSVPWSLVDETLDNTDLNTSQPTRMARTALFYYLPLNMDKDGHSLSAAPRAELDNGASGLQARLVSHMAQINEASPSEDESFTEHILHGNGNDVNEYEADLNDVSMMAWQNPQATGSGQYTRPSMGRLAANSLFREHEANASTNNSPDVQPTGSRRYMQPSLASHCERNHVPYLSTSSQLRIACDWQASSGSNAVAAVPCAPGDGTVSRPLWIIPLLPSPSWTDRLALPQKAWNLGSFNIMIRPPRILLNEDLGNWRSALRKKARMWVAQCYQWDPENHRELNIEIAKGLLGSGGLFLRDSTDEEGHVNNLTHPALSGLIINFFYRGSTLVGKLFPEVFHKVVPRMTVVLAATALKVVLDEMISAPTEVNFKVSTYSPIYTEILGLMDKCDSSPIHGTKTIALRKKWARQGSGMITKLVYFAATLTFHSQLGWGLVQSIQT
ncbi:hypothetical protein OG21DRAFT_1527035 [Imleria badia]|nr:hypothetical protein OG21DRAFT_1527035 [Imleria badia]